MNGMKLFQKHLLKNFILLLIINKKLQLNGWQRKRVVSFLWKTKINIPRAKFGDCSCGEVYIGDTKRNVTIRINEHGKWNGDSEPSKHLIKFPTHTFKWSILSTASIITRTRKNLEASFIALFKPSLNDQVLSNELNLFRNGLTWVK